MMQHLKCHALDSILNAELVVTLRQHNLGLKPGLADSKAVLSNGSRLGRCRTRYKSKL